MLEINTLSKRKKFWLFYPNKNVYGDEIVNLEKSKYEQCENGKVFDKLIFNKNVPQNNFIFVYKDEICDCYVDDNFKKLVEDNGLIGFDFTYVMEID